MFWWIAAGAVLALILVGLAVANRNRRQQPRFARPTRPAGISRRHSYTVVAIVLVLIGAAFGYYHLPHIVYEIWMVPLILTAFIWMLFLLVSAHLNPVYRDPVPPGLRSSVVIPVYNEDATTFARVLESISDQSHRPDYVYVIEDGSQEDLACRAIFEKWAASGASAGIVAKYHYQQNAGKREAQAVAFRSLMDVTDVFITIDSDTVLDPNAIEEGLRPFADERVMSVAGLLLDLNRAKWRVRALGLGFVSSFTNGRAAWSAWKGVAVNCGGLAFYRTEVIRENLLDYLTQRVFGKLAKFGDDRMLTQFATLHGRTVFQETSAAYTLMPDRISHLTRQRVRWWKSFWWGGLWILRHQSPTRSVWWLVLSQYITFLLNAVVFPACLIVYPLIEGRLPWPLLIYIAVLSYLRLARTLVIRRPDVSGLRQFLEYLVLAPVCSLLMIYLGPILQYWALITLRSSAWGTRKQVEVSLQSS
ncbi:glycosyltransferase [Leifsonia sp. McL0607]|uniref:glycosyltransferase n=1 Tax=Leifsonia sp. McL0607 TaxID=3415672 RepID=UPI003CEC5531